MKRMFVAFVLALSLLFTGACSSGGTHEAHKHVQVRVTTQDDFLKAFKKVEPRVQGTNQQLVNNAKNICGYVHTKDDWVTIIDTGEFEGLQGGSSGVRLNIVDTSLKVYCPDVWKSIDK